MCALRDNADFNAALGAATASWNGVRIPIIWVPDGCVIGDACWSVTDPKQLRQHAASPPRRAGVRVRPPTAAARRTAA